jgi:hypothetical protein
VYRGLMTATAQLQNMGYSRRLIQDSSLSLSSDAFKLVRFSQLRVCMVPPAPLPAHQRVALQGCRCGCATLLRCRTRHTSGGQAGVAADEVCLLPHAFAVGACFYDGRYVVSLLPCHGKWQIAAPRHASGVPGASCWALLVQDQLSGDWQQRQQCLHDALCRQAQEYVRLTALLQVCATLSALQPAMPLAVVRAALGPEAPPPGFRIEAPLQLPGSGGGDGSREPPIDVEAGADAAEAPPPPPAAEKKRGFWGGMQQVGSPTPALYALLAPDYGAYRALCSATRCRYTCAPHCCCLDAVGTRACELLTMHVTDDHSSMLKLHVVCGTLV